MKRGVSIQRGYDYKNQPCVTIQKSRGNLTIHEIADLLRYEDSQWNGWYVILLNCTESTMGGNGCFDLMEQQKGDRVALYEVADGDECPVCADVLPPIQYCPSCGADWSDSEKNAETLLASMRGETERSIRSASSHAARLAWYWTFIGSVDMARQMGLITDARRQEIYREAAHLKPEPLTEQYGSGTASKTL